MECTLEKGDRQEDFPGSFCVLMSVYEGDDAFLFQNAMDSILKNSVQPNQIILVVDGPVGFAIEKIIENQSRLSRNMKVIRVENKSGLRNALNLGLRNTNCQFVFRADSDDWNYPDRFEKQLRLLCAGFDLVGGSILEVSRDGEPVARRKVPTTTDAIRAFAGRRNPMNHMTVAFRRRTVLDAGGYPDLYLREDYGLWATLISNNTPMCNLDTDLVRATAGIEMYKRRGGLRYAIAELKLQSHLRKCGLKNGFQAALDGIARSAVFLLPNRFRKVIYERWLRKTSGLS